jgi:hypothetical protein
MPGSAIIFLMTNDAQQDDKNRLISLAEAADIYGYNPNYLRNLALRGRLVARKIGNSWATTPAAMEDYIENRERKGAYREDIQID